MSVYGYCRVSSAEQAADGKTSLDEQERRIRAAAVLRGEEIAHVFKDPGVSGGIPLFSRPAGGELLSNLKNGDVVIAAKMDRIFRSTSDALLSVERMQKMGISVVLVDIGMDAVTENGVSKLFFSILASVAEFERFRIAERSMEGRKGKKSRGGFIGGYAPYGYKVRGKGITAVLIEDDQEKEVITKIIQFGKAAQSSRLIARKLKDMGVVNREGRPIHHETISRILKRMGSL